MSPAAPARESDSGAIRQVTTDAGFTWFRRVGQAPFDNIVEVRP